MNVDSYPHISIIVPIHNAGIYLRECLETLVNQTMKKIEIICVLDAPTDGSDSVIKEFSENDKRIKLLINKGNLNIAESRNRGLKIAKGEYVGFSDHDDCRKLDMYEKLYEKAKKENADIVTSDCCLILKNERKIYKYNCPTKEGIISSIILPIWSGLNPNILSKSVWASIYRNDFLSYNNINFPDKRIYNEEDTLFNLKAFINASKVVHLDEVFYYWILHENSASLQLNTNSVTRQINLFNSIESLLIMNGILNEFRKDLGILVSTDVFMDVYQYVKLTKTDFLKLVRFNSYLNIKLIDRTLEKKISKKKLLKFFILKIRLALHRSREVLNFKNF